MKTTCSFLRLVSLTGLFASILAVKTQADVLYTNVFTNDNAGDVGIAGYGWAAVNSLNGANVASVDGGGGFARISSSDFFVFVGSNSGTVDNALGFVAASSFSEPVTFDELTSVTWDQRNNNSLTAMRVAVQVDTQWYVAANPVAGGQSVFTAQSLTTDANTQWAPLNFTVGSTAFSQGTSVTGSVISGTVNSIGFYITGMGTGNNGRIDNYTVNFTPASAIPEPSTFAALAGVAVLGLAAARRRRVV